MPPRMSKNPQSAQEQKAADLKQSRLALFIQQFEKEAQERMSEMEANLENMLTTVDKFFKVELMKMPPSLQNRLIEATSSDVSIAIKNTSPEIHKTLKRASSKKAVRSHNSPAETGQESSATTSKGGRGSKNTRVLAGSSSAGSLGVSQSTVKRTNTRSSKNGGQVTKTKPFHRPVSAAGDLFAGSACSSHFTITNSQGKMFCLSEETKDDVNLDMLDEVALLEMQRLMSLMEYLSSKVGVEMASQRSSPK
ncbi:hypothetical protein NHX12_014158 [Muraenolepis orangiensis]|uniref:Borealin N-terminal domain-containing protein n=1 Tax=Muraenolepis orangiensis TaxID=630683 RepID=A0A9Q0DAV9_9TELE|nr:hypothetical protein NHX12_014158 [Muraenolepis orangiensis]